MPKFNSIVTITNVKLSDRSWNILLIVVWNQFMFCFFYTFFYFFLVGLNAATISITKFKLFTIYLKN